MRATHARIAWCLLATATHFAWGCNEPVLADVEEAAAIEAVGVLAAAGIAAERRSQGRRHRVEVPPDDVVRARTVLQRAATLAPPVEAPPPRRWVLSPTEARLAARASQGRQLEQTLRLLPGVVAARVSLDVISAAVVVRVAPHGPGAAEVEALVRAGAGLGPDAPVVVAHHPMPDTAPHPSPDPTSGGGVQPIEHPTVAPARPGAATPPRPGAAPEAEDSDHPTPASRRGAGAATLALALSGLLLVLWRRRQRLRQSR